MLSTNIPKFAFLLYFFHRLCCTSTVQRTFSGTESARYTGVEVSDFVTGERVLALCDMAFFRRDYVEAFPTLKKQTHRLVFVGTRVDEQLQHHIDESSIFFTKLDTVEYFITEILPVISREFVLVTHISDFTSGLNKEVLKNPNLIRWYGCNMTPHPKVRAIPLGLENAEMWGRTDFLQIKQARLNAKVKNLYVYFNVDTNVPVREKALRSLQNNGFKNNVRTTWPRYIDDLSRHKFCASPEGNGIDTHRMWECLYLEVVPVVVKVPELYHWYSELPILWVSSFDEVTEAFLEGVDRGSLLEKFANVGRLATMDGIYEEIISDFGQATPHG